MPSTYSTLFLSGQGLAGIFAALAMLMAMASEWNWVAGGQGWPLGFWEQRQCARSEMPLVLVKMEVMGSWRLGLGTGSRVLGLYSERRTR